LENAEESDDEDEEDPISKKFKKRRRKGKADSLKKINMVNPWNVDSESRYVNIFFYITLLYQHYVCLSYC